MYSYLRKKGKWQPKKKRDLDIVIHIKHNVVGVGFKATKHKSSMLEYKYKMYVTIK